MLSKEQLLQIKKQLKNGAPAGEIREQLKEQGFHEDEIEEAFKSKPADMRSWYLFWGIVIACAGLFWRSLLLIIFGIILCALYLADQNKSAKQ